MRIEQALYGEARGGHSLLDASRNDEVSSEIVQRLDLPDTAPPGVEWSPFLRGFPYRDRYLLSRTFLDTRASRGGMVFSHALIAPLDEITRTSDLRPVLELLTADERSRPVAETIDLANIETQPPDADDLLNAAEALTSMIELPVVRAGHVGFDDLVVALWARLLPEMRQIFAFRLSFDPRDLVEDLTPALVCTPHATIGRWTGYRVIGSGVFQEPTSLASAVLSGWGSAAPLLEFMREIGAEPATFTDLRLLDQACRFSMEEPTLERCLGAVRLLGKLSPDSKVGCGRKDILVQRLREVVSEASAEQILLMRNLQLSAFPSPDRVWQTLETWAAESTYPRNQDRHMLLALKDATSDGAVAEWRVALLEGLAAAARACKPHFADAFWRWIQVFPSVVDAALHHVMAERDVERSVAAAAPYNIAEDAAKTLLALARRRGWLRVHGAVSSVMFHPLDSIRQQIAVDIDLSFIEGVRLSLRNTKPEDVLNCALQIGDPRAISLAGDAAAKHPNLLAGVDFTGVSAQAVWREALVIDSDSWQGPGSPEAEFHAVLDCLLDGGGADSSLIDRLSLTPIADLGSYPRRAETWQHVKGVTLGNLLAATTKGWLGLAADGHVPFRPEDELQSAILATEKLEPVLNGLIPDSLGTAVRIVSALDRYDENRFMRLIHDVIAGSPSLSVPDAEGIGRLVLNRQWEATAESMAEQYRSGRQDLKPALRACCDLLSLWTRFFLDLTPFSEGEKWEALEDLATELYPGGPNEQGVWERAGGNDADLLLHENGRTQWREALRNVRRGAGVRSIDILNSMNEDFPNNERILRLSGDPVFEEDE